MLSRVRTDPAAAAGPALEDTHWGLVRLGGEAAGKGAGGGVVELTLDSASGSAAGFSGCNRYNGSYSLEDAAADGAGLSFGPLASTRRACVEGMELEQRYLATLAQVSGYRLDGNRLVLLAGAEEVAVFEPL